MKRSFYIPMYGYAAVKDLKQLNNRRTFTIVYKDKFISPRIFLVKLVKYKNCFGFMESRYIAVKSLKLYLSDSKFDFIEAQKKLVKEYEESRLKNRVYLKNYKKALNG